MGSGSLRAWWAFDEGQGRATRENVSGVENAITYVFNDARYRPASDPMWRDGIRGQALLFDGYSTWVHHPLDSFETPTTAQTIAAWVAPRTFESGIGGQLSAIVNQHDRLAQRGFILGTFTHGAWSLQLGVGDDWLEVWCADRLLPRHVWSHVAATFDSVEGCLRLYLNGTCVAEQGCAPGKSLKPAVKDVLIGKHNTPVRLDHAFEANCFDGLIDELKIDASPWTPEQVRDAFREDVARFDGRNPAPDTHPRRSRYAGDMHRPRYHFIPPQHWMNEPHALLQFKGRYHITYQHNAHGPFWHNISWGHACSDDLVHWRDLPDAIYPEKDSVAPDGIWSGSANVDGDGNPVLFFTAGNNAMTPNQMTGLARSTYRDDGDPDLKRWIVHPSPVTTLDPAIRIMGQPLLPREFRDTYVWREGDFWCQLVGAGVQGIGGTALLYTSSDLVNWTYQGPLLVGDSRRYPLVSMMWELPVFLPLGKGKHIFLFSPWWAPGHPSAHFLKYVPYWIGTWDAASLTFRPDHAEPRLFDYGEHFTGPSGAVDERGRTIVFNIAQTKMDAQMAYDLGWNGNAGLPVVLFLHDDGELGVTPVPELETLHGEHLIALENVTVGEANAQLASVRGTLLDIRLAALVPGGESLGISVRRSPAGDEETRIGYDSRHRWLFIDRERTSLSANVHQRGVQGGFLDLGDNMLSLHTYLDQSMIEVYANERKSLTSRVFPTRADSTGLRVWGRPDAAIGRLDIWSMRSAWDDDA
ncbi:MAG: GH32 C-terminal domain-containing protein [Anaerolineae bacterium]|nr:GH32 C-terminal domain-containing protein [Anaerolineae bacterium]